MRVAQRTISRNYLESMNSVLERRAEALRRSEDGLRFKKLSDDVAAGARAMDTQENRYAALQQKNTAEALLKENESTWTALGTADELVQDVLKEMKSAAGVRAENKLNAIKKTISEKKAQYLQQLNSQYGSKYLFGGTNNAEPPFNEDADGDLTFNGVKVKSIYKGEDGRFYISQEKQSTDAAGKLIFEDANGDKVYKDTNGDFYDKDNTLMTPAPDETKLVKVVEKGIYVPDYPNDSPVPQSGSIYLDVGYGLKVNNSGTSSTAIDGRTAIKINVIGLDAVGFQGFIPATDTNYKAPDGNTLDADKEAYYKRINQSNNIYDLISQVEKMLLPNYNDQELTDLQLRLTDMNDQMRMARTEVDTSATALEDMISKLTDDIDSMEKLEDSLMTAPPAKEAINLKDIEYAWKAVLAVGNQILPSSLLDFLR